LWGERIPEEEQMNIDDKPQFDALMSLADFRLRRIFNRRDYEWKVTLGIWALLAAGIAAPWILQPLHPWMIMLGVPAIAVGHIAFWIYDHWDKSEKDWKLAFFYAESAEALANIGDAPIPLSDRKTKQKENFAFFKNNTSLVQVLTTLILALLLVIRVFVQSNAISL
jgi:hypothetical protein